MAISLTQSADEPFSEMNTTPLIDVMLVLLIMFIITLPVMTHSVNLNVGSAPGVAAKREPINIGVDFDGTLTLNGAEVPSLSVLETYLQAEGRSVNQRGCTYGRINAPNTISWLKFWRSRSEVD